METIIVNGITLKPYDDMYYVSKDGDVYSKYSNCFLKHNIDHDGYHRVDIHQKHMKVHKLVFIVWGTTPIKENYQINHKDDDKNNNSIENLYLGNQHDNAIDRIRNGHNVGNKKRLIVFDKEKNKTLVFYPASDFIKYCGHTSVNGSIKRFFNKKWFKARYGLVDYRNGVTTMGDECSPVGSEFIA